MPCSDGLWFSEPKSFVLPMLTSLGWLAWPMLGLAEIGRIFANLLPLLLTCDSGRNFELWPSFK